MIVLRSLQSEFPFEPEVAEREQRPVKVNIVPASVADCQFERVGIVQFIFFQREMEWFPAEEVGATGFFLSPVPEPVQEKIEDYRKNHKNQNPYKGHPVGTFHIHSGTRRL